MHLPPFHFVDVFSATCAGPLLQSKHNWLLQLKHLARVKENLLDISNFHNPRWPTCESFIHLLVVSSAVCAGFFSNLKIWHNQHVFIHPANFIGHYDDDWLEVGKNSVETCCFVIIACTNQTARMGIKYREADSRGTILPVVGTRPICLCPGKNLMAECKSHKEKPQTSTVHETHLNIRIVSAREQRTGYDALPYAHTSLRFPASTRGDSALLPQSRQRPPSMVSMSTVILMSVAAFDGLLSQHWNFSRNCSWVGVVNCCHRTRYK